MAERPTDARRDRCDELARLLATDHGRRTAELQRLLGDRGSHARASPDARPPGPRPIQIWHPRSIDGDPIFERPESGPFADHYATRRRIPAAKPRGLRRICLFGESVAAGYLYAPHLTPAMVLEAQLSQVASGQACEVLDFARTNETLDNLVATVENALQLDPDLLVLFAGNNWNLLETPECSPYFPSTEGRAGYARALRTGGLAEVAEWSAHRQLRRASDALEQIASLATGRDLALVVVVPEVNLGDWQNRQPTPWLDGQDIKAWHRHYRSGLAALARGDGRHALEHAEEMLRLDGWSGPAGYRLMSRARARLGDRAGAEDAARAEVDNALYATQALLGSPQAGTMVQTLLRRFAERHGLPLVDLPRQFGEYLEGDLPDRRLFLDYCHLTSEGMRLAMAGVTSSVLQESSDQTSAPGWRVLLDRLPPPGVRPEADATAFLGAAMHTAHRMSALTPFQPLLEYWCERAAAASPEAIGAMQRILAVRATKLPEFMTRAELDNQAMECPLTPQHGWRYTHGDFVLRQAIQAVLARHGVAPESPTVPPLPDAGLELTDPCHVENPLDCFYPYLMPESGALRRAYLRFAWSEARFRFALSTPERLRIHLTVRAPDTTHTSAPTATVQINDEAVATLPLGRNWSRHTLELAVHQLQEGINRITLVWPDPDMDGGAALQRAIARLERDQDADIHPVFGEVGSVRVCPRR